MADSERAQPQRETWEEQSDEFLLDVLRGDDADDVEKAMRTLRSQHDERLRRFVGAKLPAEQVEDVAMEIWLAFYDRAHSKQTEIRHIGAYLFGIARNKRADAVDRLTTEREIELDLPPSSRQNEPPVDYLSAEEDRLQRDLRVDHLPELPFHVHIVLSDCARVLLALREIHRYPIQTIARLLDITPNNAYQHLYVARAKVAKYVRSEDYEHALAAKEYPRLWGPPALEEEAEVIERFSEELTPRLTPEELQPLGLTIEELKSEYVSSLMIPRWFPKHEVAKPSLPFLLLAKRDDWPAFQQIHSRLYVFTTDFPDEFPEESLIRLDIDGKHISLKAVSLLQIVPEDPDGERLGNTYLAAHETGRRIPVIMAFYGSELYTEDLQKRWPFLKPGWEERHEPQSSPE